ncbi:MULTISPECIES: glutathione S-transferase N-terminal domain-containing protein [unclassified Bosea (in: a-proteobacteria)]|uniref:glutathione S-transferase family protein n=1 Tax=unclassified Bosea (in: a-proteobacteria) TaxID=2653178 RepID=UPI000F753344|nr:MULTISPECIES: glutathione S-transferase N-terminal domain-containing protein [unclassified Bosea (in: a-proteobacteria)]AZO76260.1 glutathione S-transferase [Bosea sp. Tri-49]RXT26187.1 glutathione S-transferase [Bosea sp. Tri-39]RXT31429.1 glutathione S-transferase [Bosea sp. Tri-54]
MLILRSSPTSPFGRKIKIAIAELGLDDRIEIVPADTNDPSESLRRQNPLGKVPTLVFEDGATLFDSRVIAEYLDHLAGGGRLFPAGEARFAQLRLLALADGICDAALLQVYELRLRTAEMRSAAWTENQTGKVTRALASLEAAPPVYDRPRIGEIALACALGYLDLRFEGAWRTSHLALVAWLDAFAAKVPAFEATRFKG